MGGELSFRGHWEVAQALLAPADGIVAVQNAHIALEMNRQPANVEQGPTMADARPGNLPEGPQKRAG